VWALALVISLCLPVSARASGGPFGIDSELSLDQHGIWARKYQTGLENGVIAAELVGALWFGNDDKLGHTFWQTIDASVVSGVGAELLKYTFSRARPNQGDDPNRWFKGRCCQSFPSGR
jgi:undecaprenyl-diphosphatase